MSLTFVLDKTRAKEIIGFYELNMFHKKFIKLDGDYIVITICFDDKESAFYAESVFNDETGELKHHSTDVLVLYSSLPKEVYRHYIESTEYSSLLDFE